MAAAGRDGGCTYVFKPSQRAHYLGKHSRHAVIWMQVVFDTQGAQPPHHTSGCTPLLPLVGGSSAETLLRRVHGNCAFPWPMSTIMFTMFT